ncbi:MAG: hypothetical protein Q9213_000926 [Squamulea squamosa]
MSSLLKRGLSLRRGRSASVTSPLGSKGDLPPPHPRRDSTVANAETTEKEDTEVYIDEVTALEHYVQVCPHDRLYFPRFQEIVSLPGFKDSYNGVNASSLEASVHHGRTENNDRCTCYLEYAERRSPTYGSGEFTFQYARAYERFTGPHRGVLLKCEWCFVLKEFNDINTTDGVVQFFAIYPIPLCPHKSLLDFVGPQRFLQCVQSYRQSTDPVSNFRLEQSLKDKEDCKFCNTSFAWELDADIGITVRCIRLLGKGNSPKDPIWLSQ